MKKIISLLLFVFAVAVCNAQAGKIKLKQVVGMVDSVGPKRDSSCILFKVDTSWCDFDFFDNRMAANVGVGPDISFDTDTLPSGKLSFLQRPKTIETFTGSTSLTITVLDTPRTTPRVFIFFNKSTGQAELIYSMTVLWNGTELHPEQIKVAGKKITLTGISRERGDIIEVQYYKK